MNLSSTGYLQGAPQPHHPGQLIIASSASVYTVSPYVSLPFVRREKHLKLNTGFCRSYSEVKPPQIHTNRTTCTPTHKSIHTVQSWTRVQASVDKGVGMCGNVQVCT